MVKKWVFPIHLSSSCLAYHIRMNNFQEFPDSIAIDYKNTLNFTIKEVSDFPLISQKAFKNLPTSYILQMLLKVIFILTVLGLQCFSGFSLVAVIRDFSLS